MPLHVQFAAEDVGVLLLLTDNNRTDSLVSSAQTQGLQEQKIAASYCLHGRSAGLLISEYCLINIATGPQ